MPGELRYVPLAGKRPKTKLSDGGYRLEDISYEDNIGMIIPDGVTVFDFDSDNESRAMLKLFETVEPTKLPRIVKTTRGIHVYYKTPEPVKMRTGQRLLCGAKADIKSYGGWAYVKIKSDGEFRQVISDVPLDDLPEAPEWIYPVRRQTDPITNEISKGNRNDGLFAYSASLQAQGYPKEVIKEAVTLYNQYFLDEPLPPEDMKAILRPDSFVISDNNEMIDLNYKPWLQPIYKQNGELQKLVFKHEVLAEYLIEKHHIVRKEEETELYYYEDGYYKRIPNKEYLDVFMIQEYPAATNFELNNTKRTLMAKAYMASQGKSQVNDNVLNVKNGRLNLKTLELTPHGPEHLDFQQIPTEFDPSVKSDVLDKTVDKVFCGDKELVDLFYEMCGYTLTKNLRYRKAFFLTGDGANGKSTIINLLRNMIGPENCCAITPQLFEDRFAPFALLDKLANLADDIGSKTIEQTDKYKKACTGEEFFVEKKGIDGFNIKSYATPIFAANEIPHFTDNSFGASSRRVIIPFNYTFTPDDPDFDPHVEDKLNKPEVYSAFLNHALAGLHRLWKNDRFTEPEVVKEANGKYRIENSYVGQWLDDYSIDDDYLDGKSTEEVYVEFKNWCSSQSIRAKNRRSVTKEILREIPSINLEKQWNTEKKYATHFYVKK